MPTRFLIQAHNPSEQKLPKQADVDECSCMKCLTIDGLVVCVVSRKPMCVGRSQQSKCLERAL